MDARLIDELQFTTRREAWACYADSGAGLTIEATSKSVWFWTATPTNYASRVVGTATTPRMAIERAIDALEQAGVDLATLPRDIAPTCGVIDALAGLTAHHFVSGRLARHEKFGETLAARVAAAELAEIAIKLAYGSRVDRLHAREMLTGLLGETPAAWLDFPALPAYPA